jgi:hypothetical protein
MRVLLFSAVALAFAACGGDDTQTKKDAGVVMDAPPGGPDASCFTDPHTHLEIINACTTAQKIYKDSHPVLQYSDGGLPPLP